jgi:hypothetical protein
MPSDCGLRIVLAIAWCDRLVRLEDEIRPPDLLRHQKVRSDALQRVDGAIVLGGPDLGCGVILSIGSLHSDAAAVTLLHELQHFARRGCHRDDRTAHLAAVIARQGDGAFTINKPRRVCIERIFHKRPPAMMNRAYQVALTSSGRRNSPRPAERPGSVSPRLHQRTYERGPPGPRSRRFGANGYPEPTYLGIDRPRARTGHLKADT